MVLPTGSLVGAYEGSSPSDISGGTDVCAAGGSTDGRYVLSTTSTGTPVRVQTCDT